MSEQRLLYWLICLAFNGLAQLAFWGLLRWAGYQWSWKLYWAAFAVYVILSFGDAWRRQLWESYQ